MADDAFASCERRSIERGRRPPSTIEATPTAIHTDEISSYLGIVRVTRGIADHTYDRSVSTGLV
jgi:hypothetical protein